MTESQLARLAKPFPPRFIKSNPSGGGSYVKHSVVTEKLLAVVGPFDFEMIQILRGDVAAIEPNPKGTSERAKRGAPALGDVVVGAVCRLSCEIDGRLARVDECGDCESPHNWPHDGARLKDAMSDALKRCAMRLGVTLHLWSQDQFTLYDQLSRGDSTIPPRASGDVQAAVEVTPPPSDVPVIPTTSAAASPDTSSPPSGESAWEPGPDSSRPESGPVISKNRRDALKARCVALTADNVSVADAREALKLPLVDSCDLEQLEMFEDMVADLEASLNTESVALAGEVL